jgi:hypothetical protein
MPAFANTSTLCVTSDNLNKTIISDTFYRNMKKYKHEITGHLDIFVADNEDEFEGEIEKWQNILIHGNPEGLRSFAKILMQIADLNQDSITDLPIGAREHIHLRPDFELSRSSLEVIVGRIDAKGTGLFYDRYVAKSEKK